MRLSFFRGSMGVLFSPIEIPVATCGWRLERQGRRAAGSPPARFRLLWLNDPEHPSAMRFDWSNLERREEGRWFLPANEVFPCTIVLHGEEEEHPDRDALALAVEVLEHSEIFTEAARCHLEALGNPRLWEEGAKVERFEFPGGGESFVIVHHLKGDRLAYWSIRFLRPDDGDHVIDFRPCELVRSESW